jgi:hypothetical protein
MNTNSFPTFLWLCILLQVKIYDCRIFQSQRNVNNNPSFTTTSTGVKHQSTAIDLLGLKSNSDSKSKSFNSTEVGGSGYFNSSINNNNANTNIQSIQQQQQQESIWRKLFPSRMTELMFKRFFSIFFSDPDILKTFSKACSWLVWFFVAISLMSSVGVDTKPLISLLGISGLTIGFACKDILQNTFAGFFILFTRPFKRGWIISVCGYRGKVISTDIRYLRLENLKDRTEVLIPLSLVYQNPITVEQKSI